jgi:transcriptional regulator with XRE-family HTH domain
MEKTHKIRENLKLLRKRLKRSQEEVARALGITRSAYNSYENGIAEPGITLIIKLSEYFSVSVDKLLKVDLATLPESVLSQIEKGYDMDISGTRLRVLTTTVNSSNEENIELVPVNAKAGYTQGYADPDFIRVLPAFNLPFLSPGRKYRSFPISGDSMPPVCDGAFVTGEYMQNWNLIKNGHPYIVITKDEGIVFKVLYNQITDNGSLLLCSTNPQYQPYEVKVSDILEIWKFVNYINPRFEEPNPSRDQLTNTVLDLQKEITRIKSTLRKMEP